MIMITFYPTNIRTSTEWFTFNCNMITTVTSQTGKKITLKYNDI